MPKWWSVPREWPGTRIFIVAGGPSVLGQDLSCLRGQKVIAVNSSYRTAPFADILFFGDSRWWRHHRDIPEFSQFRGRVVSVAECQMPDRIMRLKKAHPPGLSDNPQALTMRRTSLHGAINLAAFLTGPGGSIAMIGADGKPAADGRTHHHKAHPWPQKQGCWDEQRKDLETVRKPLKRMRVEWINCSPGTAWTDLCPYVSLEEALCRPLPSASPATGSGIDATSTPPDLSAPATA